LVRPVTVIDVDVLGACENVDQAASAAMVSALPAVSIVAWATVKLCGGIVGGMSNVFATQAPDVFVNAPGFSAVALVSER
jgi:hypothetical protein